MDDMDKQFLMYGLLAGGWVVILYMAFLGGLFMGEFSYSGLAISILLGGAVAAGVFFGMKKMQG